MYPRANGAAERMVRTIKNILGKSSDPYLGLLAYRTSPLTTGFSPSQLMMNRELRSTIPSVDSHREPSHEKHYHRNEMYKRRMKHNHDNRCRVKELPGLIAGERVFVRDMARQGVVQDEIPGTRSYTVQSNDKVIRCNRSALIHLPAPQGKLSESVVNRSPAPVATSPTPRPPIAQVRRSNRDVHKPRRLIE